MKFFLFLGSVFIGNFAWAGECPVLENIKNGEPIYDGRLKIEFVDGKDCWVKVTPNRDSETVRSYIFRPDGTLNVTIHRKDYVGGIGTHIYRIFPAVKCVPEVKKLPDGTYYIRTSAGAHVLIDELGQLKSINEGVISSIDIQGKSMAEVNAISGGVKISGVSGVVVDHGWRHRGDAHAKLNNDSEIKDARGKVCMVKNREMFYPGGHNPENVIEKFKTNEEWKSFVTKRCKNLQWQEAVPEYKAAEQKFKSQESAYGIEGK